MVDMFARIIEVHWLFALLIPAAIACAFVLVADVVTVLRGGYSIFTPPTIMMIDSHLRCIEQQAKALASASPTTNLTSAPRAEEQLWLPGFKPRKRSRWR